MEGIDFKEENNKAGHFYKGVRYTINLDNITFIENISETNKVRIYFSGNNNLECDAAWYERRILPLLNLINI